jgi:dihydroorotase
MQSNELVIEGKLVLNNDVVKGQVLMKNGKIIKLRKTGRAHYKTSALVFPGFVDVHTHMREPYWEYKEDFRTGSEAAVNGGVTIAFDMPNNPLPTINKKRLEKKVELSKKSLIPLYFYGGVENEFEDMPVVGYKIYLGESTGKLLTKNLEETIRKMEGRIVSFHCEPEEETIRLVKSFKGVVKNICHVSTAKGLELCDELYCEVTPHHLYFTENDELKMLPPLRSKEDRNYLLRNIGKATFLATDHAPHLPEENAYGVPGLDTYGPFVGWLIKKGVSLETIVDLTSKNASKIFGLNNYLRPGGDANLTILKLEDHMITSKNLKTKCGWSPFERKILGARTEAVVANGELLSYANN